MFLCPCRKAQTREKEKERRELCVRKPLLLGANLSLRAETDYTQYYPTFVNIFHGDAIKGEWDALIKFRNLLNQWAYCQSGLCETSDALWLDSEPPIKNVPSLPMSAWTPTLKQDAKLMFFKMKPTSQTKPTAKSLIKVFSDTLGWNDTKAPMWNLQWRFNQIRPEPKVRLAWQVMCRHQNSTLLGHKDTLKQLLQRCQAEGACSDDGRNIFDISPRTFELPSEQEAFQKAFDERGKDGRQNLWIMKPPDGTQGIGIEILTAVEQAVGLETAVVQEYLERPLLIKGYKFDLRVYVAVTSFDPLEAFVSRRGLARFTKEPYDAEDPTNLFSHLTNTSLQKYCHSPGLLNGATGCELSKLEEMLTEQGVDWPKVWGNTKDVILRTLSCTELDMGHSTNTFQLLGFDVILDADLRPWLLEINMRPSLQIKNEVDETLKPALVRNLAELVDPLQFDRYGLAKVVERRLGQIDLPSDAARERHELNEDLFHILGGRVPRRYGETIKNPEAFDRIAPSELYDKYRRRVKDSPQVDAAAAGELVVVSNASRGCASGLCSRDELVQA